MHYSPTKYFNNGAIVFTIVPIPGAYMLYPSQLVDDNLCVCLTSSTDPYDPVPSWLPGECEFGGVE